MVFHGRVPHRVAVASTAHLTPSARVGAGCLLRLEPVHSLVSLALRAPPPWQNSHPQLVTEMQSELSNEERNLLSVAYKNVVGARRCVSSSPSLYSHSLTHFFSL
jgi:hypothetical protein